MAYIILDADGWQNVTDFETGESLKSWDNPVVDDILRITPQFPYPGDTNVDSIEWTTRLAKALYEYNQPDFMLLTFATPDFVKSSVILSPEQEQELNRRLFTAAEGFLSDTGYTPVIIGTGGMSDIQAELIPYTMQGRVSHGNGLFPFAGIFRATPEELEQVRRIPHIQLFTKNDIRRDFPEASEEYLAEMPDGLILRESGYAFTRSGYRGSSQYKSPNVVDVLPIHTPLQPRHITDVYRVIYEALGHGEKVALIILEGTGKEDFLIPYNELPAKEKWMIYASSLSQYMALLSGEPFYRFGMPLVFESRPFRERSNRYPYSQFTDGDMPQNVLGRLKGVKTAAVGSRSMYTHAISQADICIECQSRQMAPSGILALINDPK